MPVPAASAPELAVPVEHPVPAATRIGPALAGGACFLAYFVGLHVVIARGDLPVVVVLLAVAPWAFAGLGLLARSAPAWSGADGSVRRLAFTAARAVVVCIGMALVVALVRYGEAAQDGVATVLYLENVAFFGWLCALFAVTLAPGREALVTRLARMLRRDDMPPALVRYTRGATLAWAVFLAAEMVVSSALFFGASRAAWSLFANLLIWPCLAAMFAGEYAVRRVLLRGMRHDSLWAGVDAFRRRPGGR